VLGLLLECLLPHVINDRLSSVDLDLSRDVERLVFNVPDDWWLILHLHSLIVPVEMIRLHPFVVMLPLLSWRLIHLL